MTFAVIVVGGQGQEMETHRGLTEGEAMKRVNDLIYKRLIFGVNVDLVTLSVINEDEYNKKKEN